MLVLPIKKKWFDMIRNGEKKEEYREIKRYYITRFNNKGMISKNNPHRVIFRNGYRKDSPQIECLVNIKIGQGKEEWGAEPNKEYYVLEIREILEVQNI